MDEAVYMDIGLGIRMKESQVEDDTGFLVSFSGLDIMGFGTNAENGLTNNIYNILLDAENNLRTYDHDKLQSIKTHLDTVNDDFRANLTNIGSRTKFLDTMQSRLEGNVTNYKTRINNLMGTDDSEAAISQTMNEYVLKAVIQMGARIIPVSLMDFIR